MSIDMFQNLGTYQKGTADIRYHRFFLATVYSCNHEFLSVFCSYIYFFFFFLVVDSLERCCNFIFRTS